MGFPKQQQPSTTSEANGNRDRQGSEDEEEETSSTTTSSTKQQEPTPPPSPPPSVSSEDDAPSPTDTTKATATSTPQVARSSSMISTSNRNLPARSGKKHSPAVAPEPSPTPTTASVPRKPVAPTASNRYPKKPPYIDAINAQAVIPAGPFVKSKLPPSNDHPQLRMVCDGQTNEETFAYLNFCRRLTGLSEFPAERVPLEEDEEALEFLHIQANGNLDQAKLLLIAALSSSNTSAVTKPWELTPSPVAPPLQDWLDESRIVLEHGGADCNQLLELVRQGKALSPSLAGAVLAQLEAKVQECEQYLAKVHGALSAPTTGAAKRTIIELRRLCTTQAPKRVVLHEVRVLQDIVLQCEQWEDAAERWLYTKSNRNYAVLAKLIEDGKRSVADHSALLHELEMVQSKYDFTIHKLQLCIPPVDDPPKNWKTRTGAKHGFELANLETLRELQLSLQELKLPRHSALDFYVNAAEEWIAQADPKASATSVKILQQQLAKTDFIPVDLTQEKHTVEQFVERANDFLKRSKAYFSSNVPPVLPVGTSMAAKKLAKQQAEAEALSRNSASFLRLKPELESLGLATYADTEMLRDVIEVVRSWTERVAVALQQQDFEEMSKLAEEQASIPVPMQPEERMLHQALAKLQWSKSARELLDATEATPLAVFEAKLEEIDHIFDTSTSGKKSVKRVKQRDMTTSSHKLECEDEVVARVDAYKKWIETCNAIVEHDTVEYGEYERCIARIAEWGHLLGSRRALLDKAVQEVDQAQQHARALFTQVLHTAQLPPASTSTWSEIHIALPIADFKLLVSKHQDLGVQTPELKLLENINEKLDQWQVKFAEALRPVRKVKRNELPYRMATEQDISALLQETRDFPAIVDLSQQQQELNQCLEATEAFRNLFSANKLDVDTCLRLFPYNNNNGGEQVAVASQANDDQRVLVRLGVMRKDNDFPADSVARPRTFQPKQAQSDALLKMMRMMKDAEQRDLPVTGVNDAQCIRLVAWLIKAYMYIQRCDACLDSANNTAIALCKFVLDGTRLLTRVDYVGESLTPAMLDQLLPSSSTVTAKTATAATPLDVYVDDDFAMLRHIRPLHVMDENDAWAANAFVVEITKRLEFMRNGLQSHFATKYLCKHVIMRLSNRKRTAATLRAMLARCPTMRKFNLDCAEETKLRAELTASEAWTQDFETKKFPLETVERVAIRGEKLWVDYAQIETLRARGKLAAQWTERVKAGLDDTNSALVTIDQLRALLNEGLELLSVDVTPYIDKLRHAVDLVCMCRAPREDKVEMMQCEDCRRDFHRECISQHFARLCPFCFVFREVDRIVARAYAAICRVSVLDKDTAAIATGVTADPRTQMLLEFCRDRQAVLETLTCNTQLPPPCQIAEIKDCIEVKAVDQALEVKKWSLQLDKRRNRPTLEDLETLIRGYPKPLKSACLVGLVHICNRGKMVLDNASQIWNLPLTTPSTVVVDRCQDAIAANKYLPLDMSQMNRALEACFNDHGQRHCLCRRFDDGGMMLGCVKCDMWFHAQCVGVHKTVDEMSSVDFVCPTCEVQARLQE